MLSDAAIETHFSPLPAQLTGLALWVCGAIRWHARTRFRKGLEQETSGSALRRQRPGPLDVTLCFAPLLRWVLSWWLSSRLALAIDPTLKGDQITGHQRRLP